MSDLFQSTCTCCGQPLPDQAAQSTPFDAFWQDAPHKIGKEAARKAWAKLSPADRKAAHDSVRSWYTWFSRTYRDAAPIHPSTYLNGRRWQDEGWRPQAGISEQERLRLAARPIVEGKGFLCTQISAAMARKMIAASLVTPEQCRAVGVQV